MFLFLQLENNWRETWDQYRERENLVEHLSASTEFTVDVGSPDYNQYLILKNFIII